MKRAFLIIFKGLLLKQIKQFFLKGESPTSKTFSNFTIIMTKNGDKNECYECSGFVSVAYF